MDQDSQGVKGKSDKRPIIELSKKDSDKEKLRLQRELLDEKIEKSTLSNIVRENNSGWVYLFVGFAASVLFGCAMPVYSLLKGQTYDVSEAVCLTMSILITRSVHMVLHASMLSLLICSRTACQKTQ